MGSTNNSSQELTKRPQKPEVEHQADSSSPEPGLTEGYFDTGNQRTGFPDEIPDSQEELGSEHQGSSSFFSETQEEPARDSLDASSSKALDETNSFIGNRHKDWQQDQVSSVENPPLQQAHPFGTHGKGEPATHNFQTQATEIIEGGTRLTPRASPKFVSSYRLPHHSCLSQSFAWCSVELALLPRSSHYQLTKVRRASIERLCSFLRPCKSRTLIEHIYRTYLIAIMLILF